MKRIIYFAMVTIVFAVAGLVFLPYLVSGESISQRLNARVVELTDNKLTYKGHPKLSLSPFLGIELFDVALDSNEAQDETASLVHIEELKFQLKILPLLFGKIRLSGFRLVRPKFNITVDDNGSINWITGTSLNRADTDVQSIPSIQLGQFDIVDGIVITALAGNPDAIRISNLNAQISWPNVASGWDISGSGVWSGEQFKFFNKTDDPLALFSSRSSAVKIKFDSPALVVSFEGTANTASSIQLRGKSNIDIPSLPRLIELMGDGEAATKPPSGKVHVDGMMTADTHEVRFDEANVSLGDNIATGNLQFYRRGEHRAKVSGTLAFGSLDITPFVDAMTAASPLATLEKDSSAAGTLDMDVRFSAQTYQLGSVSFGSMAATALVNGKDWTFDIGEAEFFDGMIVGKITSRTSKGVEEVELEGTLHNVAMENIAREWHGGNIYAAGIANAKFDFKASDQTALSDFSKFSGSIKLSMSNGRLEGIDITKAVPALDKNNGFVTFDEVKGSTPFGKLSLDLLVHNGVGWITKGIAKNESNEFRLSGNADILHGGLAIYTDIRDLRNSATPPQHGRIFVGGTVRNPLITRSPLSRSRPDERSSTDG